MARLPTRDVLGPLQRRGGGRSIASFSAPHAASVAAVGQGTMHLGRGIGMVGDAAEAIEGYDQKREAFEAERDFQAFQWSQHEALENAKRTVQPGQAATFGDDFTNTYTENAKGFFKQVPDRLKPAYEAKLFDTERRLYGEATTFGRAEQKRFSVESIGGTIDNVHRPRARITSPEEMDTITGDAERLIDGNPDLTPIEKDDLKNKSRRAIGLSNLDAQSPERVKQLFQERSRSVSTEGLLRKFEGFREGAYWDVNAFRVGYGSDTVTREDGTIVKVTKDTKVTREDAERDLARRSAEFSGVVERQVGEAWGAMPGNVRAALTSVAYNYGKLPQSVVAAVKTGDQHEIASAVSSLPANPSRRQQEARVILGGSWQPAALSALSDEDWQRSMSRAERDMDANNRRAEATLKQQRKELSDEYLKEVYSKAGKGELTQDYVEAVRPFLSPAEYRGAQKLLGADDNVDDPSAVAELVQRIDTDDPAEFAKVATGYMERGKLKPGTYISLSEKNRVASKDDQPASPYRAGYGLVKSTLDPGQMLSGAARTIAEHGRSQALVEFDNWAQANPRAPRAETIAEAQEIIKRYQIIDTGGMKLATGASRYFGTKSKNEIASTDIDEAETKLNDDINNSRLTKAQMEFEIRLLESWRAIVDREQKAKEQERGRPQRR
jgi:GH24 family phage-related lysozyme (muramidase)